MKCIRCVDGKRIVGFWAGKKKWKPNYMPCSCCNGNHENCERCTKEAKVAISIPKTT
jgi:hypothetical protein